MQDYAVQFSYMQEEKDALREFMRKKGFSQSRLAIKAAVSQSTVSRALRGSTGRHSEPRRRLLKYAGLTESTSDLSKRKGASRVVEAFSRIWDGSETHAAEIAKVIDALSGLSPIPKVRKERRVERRRKPT